MLRQTLGALDCGFSPIALRSSRRREFALEADGADLAPPPCEEQHPLLPPRPIHLILCDDREV